MPQQNSPFVSVLRREWGRMTSRRLYFGACIVLPLFCIFFMATIFGSGQMERIPIGIVDLDWSATSRDISRTVETVPTFAVTAHFSDQESARKATQQKKIYGYLVIPPNFESDVLGRPAGHVVLLLPLCTAECGQRGAGGIRNGVAAAFDGTDRQRGYCAGRE